MEEILDFMRDYHAKNREWVDGFCHFPSNHMSLVGADGEMDLYHGKLRAIDSRGTTILNDVDYEDYIDHLGESVKEWTYLKFPYLKNIGPAEGWNRVGPLSRLNVCEGIPTPRAQKRLEEYRSFAGERVVNRSLYYHWARLVEMLHCAEYMHQLLNDDDLQGETLVVKGNRRREGIGVIEAPRGTLLHHYGVSEKDEIIRCNLIVSTTHNNEAMNRSVRIVADKAISGQPEITEPMLNEIETAIRAYDPCLSCATHAVGEMPLKVELFNNDGKLLQERLR
jgi:NAD-reducing hydrogenase large subunit